MLCFCKKKFYLNIDWFTCLWVYGCSQTPGRGLSMCEENCMAHKAQNTYCMTLCRNVCCDLISAIKITDIRRYFIVAQVGRSKAAGFC